MQHQPEPPVNNDDEIDLRELWQHLLDGKQLIAAITQQAGTKPKQP
ncbi:MAG TPA: hypothetical protein PLF09_08165 [Thiotrichales bacterium]|nr:hypothetical protein [Thiotrichales bacterium]